MELTRYEPFWMTTPRRLLGGFFDDLGFTANDTFVPAVDIKETEDKYVIEVEVAGIDKKDVHIEVKDGVLTLSGERKFEHEEKKDNYTRIERSYGKFHRTFTLPDLVMEDKIEAAYKDGLLTIELPKGEEAKPKEIEVKVN